MVICLVYTACHYTQRWMYWLPLVEMLQLGYAILAVHLLDPSISLHSRAFSSLGVGYANEVQHLHAGRPYGYRS
jgi:hypothetical protein